MSGQKMNNLLEEIRALSGLVQGTNYGILDEGTKDVMKIRSHASSILTEFGQLRKDINWLSTNIKDFERSVWLEGSKEVEHELKLIDEYKSNGIELINKAFGMLPEAIWQAHFLVSAIDLLLISVTSVSMTDNKNVRKAWDNLERHIKDVYTASKMQHVK